MRLRRRPRLFTFEEGASSLSWAVPESRAERPRLETFYSVFARPQTLREAEVAPLTGGSFDLSDAAEDIGESISSRARILLTDIGRRRYDLVAEPTTRGALGVQLFPEGNGSLGLPSADGFMIAVEVADGTAIVYGLVPDDVVAVELVVDGATHPARLGENGFALEIADAPGKTLNNVLLHRRDDSVTDYFG